MTNQERYKTIKEREIAFQKFCAERKRNCHKCPVLSCRVVEDGCKFAWLTIEAEGKPLPCPFCGGVSIPMHKDSGFYSVQCDDCGSTTSDFDTKAEAIAAWNKRKKGKNI